MNSSLNLVGANQQAMRASPNRDCVANTFARIRAGTAEGPYHRYLSLFQKALMLVRGNRVEPRTARHVVRKLLITCLIAGTTG